jgi:serine/threonine protein kinase
VIGETVGHYRIVEKLGGGGMGVVFKAEDTRLKRSVALKFLPDDVASTPLVLERFQREARAASSLNHPNICTVYDIGQHDNRPFIAMELLEGQTLRHRLASRPFKIEEIIDTGVQIADALEAAHAKGITHRDIKPANIFITNRGQAKVLDFGLAKMSAQDWNSADLETAQALTGNDDLTRPGSTVGTVAYMSPEQARGDTLDPRTDLFSFGAVLYEMATGSQPFSGATSAVVFNAILEKIPTRASHINAKLPAKFEEIIEKALEKDRDLRYQSAGDIRSDLKRLRRDLDSKHTAAVQTEPAGGHRPPLQQKRQLWMAVTAVIVVSAAAFFLGRSRLFTRAEATSDFFGPGTTVTQMTSMPGVPSFPSLSPDGKSVVFSNGGDIYSMRVGGQNPVNLTKDSSQGNTEPVFSPDGERIAFRSSRDGGGIFLMGATGESVKRLTDSGFNPSWSPDGKRIVLAAYNITTDPYNGQTVRTTGFIVDVDSGAKHPLDLDFLQPSWSPHGDRIAYWSLERNGVRNGQRDLWTVRPDGSDPVSVTNDIDLDWNPVWSPDGRYLYFSSDRSGTLNLWRIPIDEKTGRATGKPEPITNGGSASRQHLTISRDGNRMVYVEQTLASNIYKVDFDPTAMQLIGAPTPVTEGNNSFGSFGSPVPSPDGQFLAFTGGVKREDIYVVRTDGTGLRHLTDDDARDRAPQWSPDGKEIAFYSNRSGSYQIFVIKADGSGLRPITDVPNKTCSYPVWSPDGKRMAFECTGHTYIVDLGTAAIKDISANTLPMMPNGDWMRPASWSPDGRKISGSDGAQGGGPPAVVYDVEEKKFEMLSGPPGGGGRWLSDSRRLLQGSFPGRLNIRTLGQGPTELASLPGFQLGGISQDDRHFYGRMIKVSADLWTINIQPPK